MNPAGRRAARTLIPAAALVGAAAAWRWRRRAGRGSRAADLLTTERAARTAQLARIGARAGSDYAGMRARAVFASAARREALRDEFELRTAEQVVEALGDMKGALMKLGQMASYLDQGLPEPVRDALSQLQNDAPPMAAELVEQVVRDELGGLPGEVFAEFDLVPIASASIGQVHRAMTWDGRAVAVKVQYPGVDRAVSADLQNTDLLFQLMGMLFPGLDPKPIVEELKVRLVEELDYRLEARNQRLFADAYRGHPFIYVPEVVDELCTSRVLTTELAEGARFSEVVEWSDEERQLTAECLYRFAFGSIYQLHAFNGDPHPGNYLFRPGGQITFLDFGLCKIFTPEEVTIFERMIRAIVLDRDVPAFRRIISEIGILAPDLEVPEADLLEYFGHFYEFVMDDEVREITPEYSSESVRRFFDLTGPHAEIMKAANLPPSMVIVQRINLGLFALFGDLRARNNWRRIAEELWPFVQGPPCTPMGEEIARWEAGRSPRR
jgi:predicted unusual protein kinase regulating ubiquinone biosynthesis (AarF/ABC1/UbiB family)